MLVSDLMIALSVNRPAHSPHLEWWSDRAVVVGLPAVEVGGSVGAGHGDQGPGEFGPAKRDRGRVDLVAGSGVDALQSADAPRLDLELWARAGESADVEY